jgi:multidrug efflux system outer membrane protein
MKKSLAFITIGLLSACSVGPDYDRPSFGFNNGWFSSDSNKTSQQDVQIQWWKVFNDPLLTKYIEQATINNKDVQVAMANVTRARALRRENSSGFFPTIGSNAQASRSKSSDAVSSFNSGEIRNLYDAGFDASWELDIFGGTRRSTEAADARVGSAIASYHDVMLTTLSDVARTYYEARGFQKRIAITRQNADLLKQTYDLLDIRLEAGESSQFDVTRAKGEYEATLARLPNLEADLETSVFTLSVLLGLPPETLLAEMREVKPLPVPPDIVPVGLRSDILRRRPDVQMAERELAASTADIGAETAELFPKFFLTGDIGSQARVFGDLFTAAGGLWSLAAAMQWSVFEGGAIRARIDVEKAENKAALATYEKTVLEALADAETALTRYGREIETRQRLEQSLQSRREAVRLAQELLDVGESDYLAVLDAQRELTSAEDTLVVSETNTIIKLVALYAALGGGWQNAAT